MTIAISLKVNDGVVLGSDSASTLIEDASGNVRNVYNSANKIFNLKKGLPIGAITWGSGAIGAAAISTLAKDLRRRFSGEDPAHTDWALDRGRYTIGQVADRLKQFMFDEFYTPTFASAPKKPFLGFMVAGFSANGALAEEYEVEINDGQCKGPTEIRPTAACGVTWRGVPEAIHRLVLGFGSGLPAVLEQDIGIPNAQIAAAIQVIRDRLATPLVEAAMPIQDAIDLVEFLVDLTIRYSRFSPGAPTVGGPIEIAAITKHEGFNWVRRKHYFSRELNPPEATHG